MGSSSGFRSNITVLIDDDVYIILLSNVLSSWVNDARDALAAIVLGKPYAVPADRVICIDPQLLDEYVGTYDHPLFTDPPYRVLKKEGYLYTPDHTMLVPVGKDQFWPNTQNKNMLYTFVRDEKRKVCQLHIKGGYYEIRCTKHEQPS